MTGSCNLQDEEDDEAFLRSVILPEEDRRRFNSAFSSLRWFRSPNVIDLVRYRRNMTAKTEKHEQKP
jgi:hypothetical protein